MNINYTERDEDFGFSDDAVAYSEQLKQYYNELSHFCGMSLSALEKLESVWHLPTGEREAAFVNWALSEPSLSIQKRWPRAA
jgi:hypothetical protein